MSDSVSTVSTNLSNMSNMINCQSLLTNTSLIVLLCCIIFLLMSMISIPQNGDSCRSEFFTDLSNFTSPSNAIFPAINSFKRVDLTSPNSEINTPTNLLTGYCNRYIMDNSLLYEIYTNLYLLNGNVFAKTMLDDSYNVYLVNEQTSNKELLGQLTVGGDRVYKLKKITEKSYLQYSHIHVTYKVNDIEKILLVGKF